jgi:hypothetical protein
MSLLKKSKILTQIQLRSLIFKDSLVSNRRLKQRIDNLEEKINLIMSQFNNRVIMK